MDAIFNEIREERARQDQKFGEQNHKPVEWMAILVEEVGEVSKEALEAHFEGYYKDATKLSNYRKELIQVAAVAVAMVECFDRNDLDGFPEKPDVEASVYVREECVFHYCDSPEVCKANNKCRHR